MSSTSLVMCASWRPRTAISAVAVSTSTELDEVHRRHHRRERIAHLVAHDREKLLVSALGLLRLREPQPLLLGGSSLGEIPRHLREADQRAFAVAKRGDSDVGPEERAVLAEAPSLLLEAALARRHLELALALARLDVGARVELREVVYR